MSSATALPIESVDLYRFYTFFLILSGSLLMSRVAVAEAIECLRRTLKLEVTHNGGANPEVVVRRNDGSSIKFAQSDRGLEELKKIFTRNFFKLEELRGKRVLDVGAGRGQFVADLRSHEINATGIDLSVDHEHVVEAAKPYVAKGDALHLPFRDESFSVIYSHYAISYLQEQPEQLTKALKEAARVLLPNGVIRVGPFTNEETLRQCVGSISGLSINKVVTSTRWSYFEIQKTN